MKKKLWMFLLLIGLVCSFNVRDVYASTNTFERTNENLLVQDYISVNDSNINDILNTPAVDASEKIYDFADLFSDSEESKLYDKVLNYIRESKLDMAIVTINENNKMDSTAYADDFYDYNDFGYENSNSGLLFLIDMDNREIYITTTGDGIDKYPDSVINSILDYVYTFMSNEKYYEGCSSFLSLASSYASLDSSQYSSYTINSNGQLVKNYRPLAIVLIFAIVGDAIIIFIMVRMNKMVFKAASSRQYLNNKTKSAKVIKETFLGSHVSKVKIESDSSSGGGIHTSGGGVSHGGGGHKF